MATGLGTFLATAFGVEPEAARVAVIVVTVVVVSVAGGLLADTRLRSTGRLAERLMRRVERRRGAGSVG